eukprot:10278798-Alexandrium_andersonii.AAC.1
MPLSAAAPLATMYNQIEEGGSWPSQVRLARAVFLGKGRVETCSSLDYRILSITSHIYRKWATIRLHHMQEWTSNWLDADMYGGFKNTSAQTASWAFAVQLEHAAVTGASVSAMSVDIAKCFDQVPQQL